MKKNRTLTENQSKVLSYLQGCKRMGDQMPTQVELAEVLEFNSGAAVRSHLQALEKKGYLVLAKGVGHRNIHLLHQLEKVNDPVQQLEELRSLVTLMEPLILRLFDIMGSIRYPIPRVKDRSLQEEKVREAVNPLAAELARIKAFKFKRIEID